MMNFYFFNEWKMEYHSEKESRRNPDTSEVVPF